MLRVALLTGWVLAATTAVAGQAPDLTFDATITFYGDNTEFSNPFRRGQTLLGTWAKAFVDVRTSDRLVLRAGVFGNQRFGSDDGFDEVRPVLALAIGSRRSRLILGTLESVRRMDGPGPDRTGPHDLLPPIQIETLAFDRPWEAGMQWLLDTPRVTQDVWVHWQRLNERGRREVFDTGLRTRVRASPVLAFRGDLFLVHQGGQLSAEAPVADSFASALGAEVGGRVGALDRLAFEAFALASRYVPNREDTRDARSGFATFLRVSAEKGGWRGHAILFRGDDFIAREGDPQYQSIRRDGTSYRSLRDYAEAGLTRLFPLASQSWLEASARWHRVENDYEYSFCILAVARLTVK
jgi:hypothetical protein